VWVVVSVLAGGAILFPSLALLFRLTLTGRFQAEETPPARTITARPSRVRSQRLARGAIASLIAGFGLLNVAEAPLAHGIGIAALFCFVALGSRAILFRALGEEAK
jgi:cytochrome d ubiquinol oxidase subunit II